MNYAKIDCIQNTRHILARSAVSCMVSAHKKLEKISNKMIIKHARLILKFDGLKYVELVFGVEYRSMTMISKVSCKLLKSSECCLI